MSLSAALQAQVSGTAYRALGQPDLRRNGVNRVEGVELYAPGGIALDTRGSEWHLYVADTLNHRVLGWRNVRSYTVGDPPDVVLGQPSAKHSAALGIGVKGFLQPTALAVEPATGNLYVADTGNHRVLRFGYPFADTLQVEPEAVLGQPDFATRGANSRGLDGGSLNQPRGVAFDAAGNLWVADTGNHRVLRFNAASLSNPSTAEADLVLGQGSLTAGRANRGVGVSASGFDSPTALALDARNNLYVADTNNARVLRFHAPLTNDAAAAVVFGQANFTSRGVAGLAGNLALAGPTGVAVDAAGNLFVAVPAEHRVMVFDANAVSGTPAREVLGQSDFNSTQANAGSFPLASARSLSGPSDVKTDPEGNVYVADTGNHRVLALARNGKTASRVWGQNDFSANGANQIKAGSINAAFKIAIDYSRTPFALYVSDTNNHRILGWRDATSFRTGDPADLVIGQPDMTTALANIDTRGAATPSAGSLSSPKGIAVDAAGNLYVADSGNHRVLRYPRPFDQTGRVLPDLVIGQPDFQSAHSAAVNAFTLRAPAGVAIGPEGSIFVADAGNNRVLEFPAGSGNRPSAVRVLGQPNFTTAAPLSPASAQTLRSPQGIFVDGASTVYVADTGNNRVLVFPNTRDAPAGGATAFLVIGQDTFQDVAAGSGATRLRTPADVVVDGAGNIYVSDTGNNRVLVFPSLLFLPLSGAAAAQVIGQRDLAGTAANWNSADGLATPQGLFAPLGLFVDRRDTLYVGDAGNNRVLHFLKPAVVSHAANAQAGAALARGGLVTITGTGLAEREQTAEQSPLPLALAGREVVIDDQVRAPLASVKAEEIQLQMPLLAPLGTARLAVRVQETGELVAGSAVVVASVSPGLFSGSGGKYGVLNQDGSANSAANPALKGSVIRIFGTGQGPVSPQVGDGETASEDVNTVAVPTTDGNACLARQPSVCVAIGNTFGEVQFSGLAAGQVGIWELRVRIPLLAPSGNAVPVRALINGAPSNVITVAIR